MRNYRKAQHNDIYDGSQDPTIQTRLTLNVRMSRFLKWAGGTSYLREIGAGGRKALAANLQRHAQLIEMFRKDDRLVFHRLEIIQGVYPVGDRAMGKKIKYALIDPFGNPSIDAANAFKILVESNYQDFTFEYTKDNLEGPTMIGLDITIG